jgi:spore maturation protein CgeB
MKVLAPLLRYDYGNPLRGDSLEKSMMVPGMASCAEVIPFWLEEHGYPGDPEGLQSSLIAAAERCNPDLIFFVLMRDEVSPITLSLLRQRWTTSNWFADDQWRFNTFSRNVAPLFDYPITVDKFSVPRYREIGCSRVILAQWASPYVPLPRERDAPQGGVSFIGSRNSVRDWYIESLRLNGIVVHCYGAGWPEGRVDQSRMQQIVASSKISLNLTNSRPRDIGYFLFCIGRAFRSLFGVSRTSDGYVRSLRHALGGLLDFFRSSKTVEQIKARNFEIPAWGGFQLSQFALGIDDYFIPGKEIVLFSTMQELFELVHHYLANDSEREAVRSAGNIRAAQHTYEQRFLHVFGEIAHDKGESGSS